MRLSRARAAVVLLLAVLHVGGGVVSALALCCEDAVHSANGPMMECCLKGGPNHICPFMSKGARKKIPNGGRLNAGCGSGHDQGVPVIGFAGLPQDLASAAMPETIAVVHDRVAENAIARVSYPPTPPPKHLL